MKPLSESSISELVRLFVEYAIRQDDALLGFNTKEVNRLYDKINAIKVELKSRPGDQRSALIPLLAHPNPQVRLKAAVATLAIVPFAAREILESLRHVQGPQRLDAGMTLWALDDGRYKPT